MTAKKKAPKGVYIRSWDPARKDIQRLAKQLFEAFPKEHKAAGITRPSARVAVDYLRTRAAMGSIFKMGPQNEKNNAYLALGCNEEVE